MNPYENFSYHLTLNTIYMIFGSESKLITIKHLFKFDCQKGYFFLMSLIKWDGSVLLSLEYSSEDPKFLPAALLGFRKLGLCQTTQ